MLRLAIAAIARDLSLVTIYRIAPRRIISAIVLYNHAKHKVRRQIRLSLACTTFQEKLRSLVSAPAGM